MYAVAATEGIMIRVNGSQNFSVHASAGEQQNFGLRGIAMSDSPVLIEGGDRRDRDFIAQQIHMLGRRNALPIHECSCAKDIAPLLDPSAQGEDLASPGGTWLLHDISGWPRTVQQNLGKLLSQLNLDRIQGLHAIEALPRIVALTDSIQTKKREDGEVSFIEPGLRQRLSFFHISIEKPCGVSGGREQQ
jgi:DNA-binding NtrC family response regulator